MRAATLLTLALALGCDPATQGDDAMLDAAESDGESGEAPRGPVDCEAAPVVTYDTFGRGFLATYCDGCHAGSVALRQGAPDDVVFDTRDDVDRFADRILARTQGDDPSEATMPPVGGVTEADAERLAIWLTCWP